MDGSLTGPYRTRPASRPPWNPRTTTTLVSETQSDRRYSHVRGPTLESHGTPPQRPVGRGLGDPSKSRTAGPTSQDNGSTSVIGHRPETRVARCVEPTRSVLRLSGAPPPHRAASWGARLGPKPGRFTPTVPDSSGPRRAHPDTPMTTSPDSAHPGRPPGLRSSRDDRVDHGWRSPRLHPRPPRTPAPVDDFYVDPGSPPRFVSHRGCSQGSLPVPFAEPECPHPGEGDLTRVHTGPHGCRRDRGRFCRLLQTTDGHHQTPSQETGTGHPPSWGSGHGSRCKGTFHLHTTPVSVPSVRTSQVVVESPVPTPRPKGVLYTTSSTPTRPTVGHEGEDPPTSRRCPRKRGEGRGPNLRPEFLERDPCSHSTLTCRVPGDGMG